MSARELREDLFRASRRLEDSPRRQLIAMTVSEATAVSSAAATMSFVHWADGNRGRFEGRRRNVQQGCPNATMCSL